MIENDLSENSKSPNPTHYDQSYPARDPADLDLSIYTLTIGEASSLLIAKRCKFASNRKVQRMCRDGVIDCYKLQTTRNGQPVSEWLVNEISLRKHIDENEIKWDESAAVPPPVSGNASVPPIHHGDASEADSENKSRPVGSDHVATPDLSGDAVGDASHTVRQENIGDAMATPGNHGDAIGETRSLASVLIENAKLTAELGGTRSLIEEIRLDKDFLKEELTEARAGRKDVTAIAQRMLETLETIAIGGKLMPPSPSQSPNEDKTQTAIHGEIVKPTDGDNRPSGANPYAI